MKKFDFQRAKIASYFSTKANELSIPLTYEDDYRHQIMFSRVFDSKSEDREILVEYAPTQALALDYYFTNSHQENDTRRLMYVISKDPSLHIDCIWRMYVAWIVERVSEAVIEDKFAIQ
jgi:hypothetical protein